jgi:ABC-type nitrate/sulfonate/bicarbonate transport system substrate-binding protein
MALQRGPGVLLLGTALVLAAAAVIAGRLGYLTRLERRLFPAAARTLPRLSTGDFPAGVAAPVGDLASVPLRPTLIGFVPRGSAAALLLAAGGATTLGAEGGSQRPSGGLFRTAYALDAKAVVFGREDDLRAALALGAERGGVDMAAMPVDRLAAWSGSLRDAAPRTLLLLGRSRGQEALAGVGLDNLTALKGKRLGTYPQSPAHYFALWVLSRAGLSPADVRWLELDSSLDAGAALREGRAEVVAGLWADLELAARDRGGQILATSADAPHLIATVLVCRGEFAARYPDAVRRVLRGLLDAAQGLERDPTLGTRLLGEVAPYLGDPKEALQRAPPADLKDNLSFFGLLGEAPVTYDELFRSSAALFVKLGKLHDAPEPEDTRDLGALRYVAEARGP